MSYYEIEREDFNLNVICPFLALNQTNSNLKDEELVEIWDSVLSSCAGIQAEASVQPGHYLVSWSTSLNSSIQTSALLTFMKFLLLLLSTM